MCDTHRIVRKAARILALWGRPACLLTLGRADWHCSGKLRNESRRKGGGQHNTDTDVQGFRAEGANCSDCTTHPLG